MPSVSHLVLSNGIICSLIDLATAVRFRAKLRDVIWAEGVENKFYALDDLVTIGSMLVEWKIDREDILLSFQCT